MSKISVDVLETRDGTKTFNVADLDTLTAIAAEVANRVRYDAAQTLTAPQQAQARTNIDAAAASDVSGLITGLGTYDHDYAADYAAAKA